MLTVGAIFDRYHIVAELGAGGMGRVYRAFDTKLQRAVALKVLTTSAFDTGEENQESVARMLREARAAAAFEHAGKVAVYDVGQVSGITFIAMELVLGKTLRSYVGANVSIEQRVVWLSQVAQVLAAAHAVGLVHRDVKPENVMIREDGGVKVLDFGIARRTAQPTDPSGKRDLAEISTLTQKGASLGTPLYMAPEQINAQPLDGRADQFAWGIMAYELLCTRHPWAQGRDVLSTIGAILSEPTPVFPDACAVPNAVQGVVRRALSKAAADRFRTFDELLSALAGPTLRSPAERAALESAPTEVFLPQAPVTTKVGIEASIVPQVAKGKRRWWPFLVLSLSCLALGAFALYQGRKQAVNLRRPEVGLHAIDVFRNPRGADLASLDSAGFWGAAARDFDQARHQDHAPARWHAAQRFVEGQELMLRDHVDEAIGAFKESIRIDSAWAVPRAGLCAALARVGRLDEALPAAEEAQRLEPDWWPAIAAAARANAYARRLEQAIQDYRRALGLAPGQPHLLGELALVYHAARLDSEAERFAKQALDADPDLVPPRVMLAERALERGDGETALREATRAVAVLPKGVPGRLALADALVQLKRGVEAREAYRTAFTTWQEEGGGGPIAGRMRNVQAALARGVLPDRADDQASAVEPRTPAATLRSPGVRAPPSPSPRSPPGRSPAAKPSPDFGF